jgi:CysZ protein
MPANGVPTSQVPVTRVSVRATRGSGREFAVGVGCLLRGIAMYAKRPRLMLLGLVPAVISAVVLAGALVALVVYAHDLAVLATPFADRWSSGLRQTTVVLAELAIVGVGVLLSVLFYTALTLLIGEPFYEAISKGVDDELGGLAREVDVAYWRALPRGIVDTVRLIVFSGVCGAGLFVLGLIPVVGETVVPVLAAAVGGWALVLELTSVPFERRGLRFRHRKQMLRQARPLGLGFGVATFVCFLVPLGAVLLMPAAVAGATLLSRRLFESLDQQTPHPAAPAVPPAASPGLVAGP